jgi:hypothetical protein
MLLNGCKEVGPVVPWGNNGTFTDTTFVDNPVQHPQAKNALIEEYTGVSCPNCPAAHVVLDNLININNHKVIGVSYHVGPQMFTLDANPPGWTQSLVSTDAQTIVNYFTNPQEGPIGSVNRILHNDPSTFLNTSIWDFDGNWSGYVNTELAETPPVNVNVSCIYNSSGSTRQLNIYVGLHYTAAQSDTDKLSIYLTEDSIITAQLLSGNSGDLDDTNYVHNHIMRAAVTNPLGNIISVPSFAAGRADSLAFTYVLTPADSLWKPANMNVVALVHKYQNGREDVLQVQTTRVVP